MGETAALAVLDVEDTSAVSRDGRDELLFIETLAKVIRRRTLNTARTQLHAATRKPLHAASRAADGLRSSNRSRDALYAPCFRRVHRDRRCSGIENDDERRANVRARLPPLCMQA
jgi:hypothetical protein